jgi:hypothetical protein
MSLPRQKLQKFDNEIVASNVQRQPQNFFDNLEHVLEHCNTT